MLFCRQNFICLLMLLCISIWQLWEYILNLCQPGLTEHAGRGQATDGTSIPHPGCEFMFSRLRISLHIHLFGSTNAFPSGHALYAISAFGLALQTETLIHLKLLKCTFRIRWEVVLWNHFWTQEKPSCDAGVPLVYPSHQSLNSSQLRHATVNFFVVVCLKVYSGTELYKSTITVKNVWLCHSSPV